MNTKAKVNEVVGVLDGRACPNCSEFVVGHKQNGCVLAALINVIRDREGSTEGEIHTLHADCDPDGLWTDLGPIIDRLGAGEYS